MKDLDHSIEELKRLREQTQELGKPIGTESRRWDIRKHTDSEYNDIRKAKEVFKALHDTFTIAWAKGLGSEIDQEMQHTVRLFINTEVQEDVYTTAAITCDRHPVADKYTPLPRAFISDTMLTISAVLSLTRERSMSEYEHRAATQCWVLPHPRTPNHLQAFMITDAREEKFDLLRPR